jgi:glyoxylase-like metal-dependent hydrolase (beta-lactamase superfamily II)
MTKNAEIMLGLELPDVALWSDRVAVALGQNPGPFTGPGTNSYLIGTGSHRILLDPGEGAEAYLPVLESALDRAGCVGIQEIVVTHAHQDHIGGVASVLQRFGPMKVSKKPWPGADEKFGVEIDAIDDGALIRTENATLRAIHTPGHAPDHLSFMIDEERALISGDNILGVGTAVIPLDTGDLLDYVNSLERVLAEAPGRIYPAHGPLIEDGPAKIREYIAHRNDREREILAALEREPMLVTEIVGIVYAAYPKVPHPAAGQSVTQHLLKLERENRVTRKAGANALSARWALS